MPERIPIELDRFKGKKLSLQAARFWSGPKIFENDAPLKRQKGKYLIRDNGGREAIIKLKYNLIDSIPRLVVDGETIDLVAPLKWYEMMWIGLPVLLIFAGGAIGAVLGFLATSCSGKIFRSNNNIFAKYLLTGILSGFSILAYILAAGTIYNIAHHS
jgi:hypothetical protein